MKTSRGFYWFFASLFLVVTLDCAFAQSPWTTKLPPDRQQAPPALDPSLCQDYARTAVAQNEENLRKQCGFTGPRWQSNFNAHLNWCRNIPNKDFAIVGLERQARAEMLKRCLPPPSLDAFVSETSQTSETVTIVGMGFTPNSPNQVIIYFSDLPNQSPRQSGTETTGKEGDFKSTRTFTFEGAPVTCDVNARTPVKVTATDKTNNSSVSTTVNVSKCGRLI